MDHQQDQTQRCITLKVVLPPAEIPDLNQTKPLPRRAFFVLNFEIDDHTLNQLRRTAVRFPATSGLDVIEQCQRLSTETKALLVLDFRYDCDQEHAQRVAARFARQAQKTLDRLALPVSRQMDRRLSRQSVTV
jgi:hypothetical protein